MERKTWRRSVDGYEDVGLRDGVSVGDAICDLAAFEDTGLEPEEITELAQAKRDGRCVVLPCSTGRKVWSGKWRDDLSECVYVRASSMLSDIEHGNVIRYTREAAEAALEERK